LFRAISLHVTAAAIVAAVPYFITALVIHHRTVCMSHPRKELDDLLQHPVRLSIVGALSAAVEVEFAYLRDLLA